MPSGPDRYQAVLDSLDEVVFETDTVGRWTYLNAAWTKITGFGINESLGEAFLDFVHPEERASTLELFERVVHGDLTHCRHETRYRVADGSYRWIELRASMLLDESGTYTGNVGTIVDITERRRAEFLLAEQSRLLEMVARDIPLDETLGALASSVARNTGYEVAISRRPTADEWSHAGAAMSVVAGPNGDLITLASEYETDDSCIDVPIHAIEGDNHLGRCVLRPVDGGDAREEPLPGILDRVVHLAAIAISRELVDAQARHTALHDPLTGLPNRALVVDRLQQAITMSGRHNCLVALLLLDLDHFKIINDTFGHETGDRVLQQVAERLHDTLRDSDTIGRLGGDEFAIVLPEVARVSDAERVAENARRAVREPLTIRGVEFHPEVSIGIAVSSGPLADTADLLRFADVAMYRAKREGVGHSLYDPNRDAARLRGFGLAGQLRYAIDHDQLVLHYQPKIDLATGDITGMEGLVRWQHPTRGLIGPGDFIPLAEVTGAIRPLLRWVLRTALEESRAWRAEGLDGTIAVNVSAQSLYDPDLPELVRRLLADEQESAGDRLELEITESAIMADPEGALVAMSRLEELGVLFAIDDFGVGYSSLSYLKRLPARCIKIDKTFVRDMDRDERDASIVRTAVSLAHDLHIDVVAEGVETPEVCELLKDLRCDSAQGFLFARPMPGQRVVGWLKDYLATKG